MLCFNNIKENYLGMQVLFFRNAAVSSRKIFVKAKCQIRTPYRQILNIKGLGSVSG